MPDQTDQFDRLKTALADRYPIERKLGQGGMAIVYLAEDLKHHRPVAIKVLHHELAAAIGPERFLREIQITARLDHPHILPLLDSDSAQQYVVDGVHDALIAELGKIGTLNVISRTSVMRYRDTPLWSHPEFGSALRGRDQRE